MILLLHCVPLIFGGKEFCFGQSELLSNAITSVLHDTHNGVWVVVGLAIIAPGAERLLVTLHDRINCRSYLIPGERSTPLLIPYVSHEGVAELLNLSLL